MAADLKALRDAYKGIAKDQRGLWGPEARFILSQIDRVEGCEGCGGDGSHCGHKDCTHDYCTNLRADLAKLAAEVL